jgi:ribosomal protein S8
MVRFLSSLENGARRRVPTQLLPLPPLSLLILLVRIGLISGWTRVGRSRVRIYHRPPLLFRFRFSPTGGGIRLLSTPSGLKTGEEAAAVGEGGVFIAELHLL